MSEPHRRSTFQTTRWSLVRATAGEDSAAARTALASLCEAYWFPLYVYVRRHGHGPEDAQDLTQAFLLRLLERHDFARASPERGRLRTFLLAALKHFLINDGRDRRAEKRGGGRIPVSIDGEQAEGRYLREPIDVLTPEALFERRWAFTAIDRALERLRHAWAGAGKADRFNRLQPCLVDETPSGGYAGLALDLGISEGAVKVAVHRLKKEFRHALADEVADTVEDRSMVQAEIKDLLRIVRQP